jgi:hypothetical protein
VPASCFACLPHLLALSRLAARQSGFPRLSRYTSIRTSLSWA